MHCVSSNGDYDRCMQEICSSFEDTCSVLTCRIEAACSLLCKCIQANQFNAGALPAGGSDDDDRSLFKENKKGLFYYPAVLFKKKKKHMAVLRRSVGPECLIELLIQNGL